jgi:hypothetical protein
MSFPLCDSLLPCLCTLCDSLWPIDKDNTLQTLQKQATPKKWEQQRRHVFSTLPFSFANKLMHGKLFRNKPHLKNGKKKEAMSIFHFAILFG